MIITSQDALADRRITETVGFVKGNVVRARFFVRDIFAGLRMIVGGEIPFVYLKRRTADGRFSNDNKRVDLAETRALYTEDEIAKIRAFARAMQLDFGGLDVLRDREDGRLYIVDVNKTDMGPPTALPGRQKLRAMRMLADAFADLVDRRMGR